MGVGRMRAWPSTSTTGPIIFEAWQCSQSTDEVKDLRSSWKSLTQSQCSKHLARWGWGRHVQRTRALNALHALLDKRTWHWAGIACANNSKICTFSYVRFIFIKEIFTDEILGGSLTGGLHTNNKYVLPKTHLLHHVNARPKYIKLELHGSLTYCQLIWPVIHDRVNVWHVPHDMWNLFKRNRWTSQLKLWTLHQRLVMGSKSNLPNEQGTIHVKIATHESSSITKTPSIDGHKSLVSAIR